VSAAPRKRAVFLDRDGVLIHAIVRDNKPFAVTALDQVRLIEGVAEACAKLSQLGYLLILTTNQPDVARGKISRSFVDQVNSDLAYQLKLDMVRLCDHDDKDGCNCRKPKPGLMTEPAAELGIDLGASFVVGDRWRDVEAGQRAGCRTVFIDYGYDETLGSLPDHKAPSLLAAVDWIAQQT